jgi:two-component system OmpR family sensor kinase
MRSVPTEGFSALARRLIGWYVLVAVAAATVLVAAVGIIGLFMYAREINESLALAQRNAGAFAADAARQKLAFGDAALQFERNVRREGIHSFATIPHRQPLPPSPQAQPPPRPNPNEISYVDGVVRHGVGLRNRYEGSRFGFAVATIFGVRPGPPQPFLTGVIAFAPDSFAFQNFVLWLLFAVVAAGTAAGLLAFAVGRFITLQAIRPLIDVTEALQRFAARDFRAQPIAVGGRSDFGVLAHAYNAASAQVEAAFAERDAAEAQMRQFVADAGHELRTPLTIILGYIDLLQRRLAGDDRTRYIFSSVASEGRRMRTLVDNLVLLTKLEGEDLRPAEPFGLRALIDEIVELRRGLDPSVAFGIAANVDATVIGDRAELHEALANIVDNAIKYAPGSPIRIALDAAGANAVQIAIADDGPGIAPEDREAIFERFYRGQKRGDVEGSGLGLAIAKRAVERAGGTLRLDPDTVNGTRFIVLLRADRIAAPAVSA